MNQWKEKLGYGSHYWNVFDDGGVVDLSREQFPPDFPYELLLAGELNQPDNRLDYSDKRLHILKDEKTVRRYEMLKDHFKTALNTNPLFTDEKFQLCWELAFSENSVCPKRRFACLVYKFNHSDCEDALVTSDVNRLMTTQFGTPRFCSLDGSKCIRLEKESRQDADLGDCGHAPLWCLSKLWDMGYPKKDLRLLNFYEAGFMPYGSPWWRDEASYTCTHCENMFAQFGLDKIYGAFGGKWQPLYTKDSFYNSAGYALD